MSIEQTLPSAYAALAPFVTKWARETEQERFRVRLGTSRDDIAVFYDAIFPHMDSILTELAAYPADSFRNLPKPIENLYRLALAFMEASHPIDLRWQGNDIDDAFPADRVHYPLNLG